MTVSGTGAPADISLLGFIRKLLRPVIWVFEQATAWYSRLTLVLFAAGALVAAGFLTSADLLAWLAGGLWLVALAALGNAVVLAWVVACESRVMALRRAAREPEAAPGIGPSGFAAGTQPTALSVLAEWGGVGWKRDSQSAPQPMCPADLTPLMVGHEDWDNELVEASSKEATHLAERRDGLAFLQCPRCDKVYELPLQSLVASRKRANAVLMGELRRQRGERVSER